MKYPIMCSQIRKIIIHPGRARKLSVNVPFAATAPGESRWHGSRKSYFPLSTSQGKWFRKKSMWLFATIHRLKNSVFYLLKSSDFLCLVWHCHFFVCVHFLKSMRLGIEIPISDGCFSCNHLCVKFILCLHTRKFARRIAKKFLYFLYHFRI